jgi:Protein of unknown function (DUF3052)
VSSPIVPLGARSRNEWLRAGQSSCSDSATNEAGVGGQGTGNEQCTRQRGTRVVAADDAGRTSDIAGKLGVEPGMVVQELGWDSDVDEAVRDAVEERAGDDLLDEEADDVIDLVLLWWRDGDGDLVDALINAIGPLAENGVIWVLTPKTGRPGHVEPSDIAEAAPTAGLSQTSNITVSEGWVGSRLVSPKAAKSRR